MDEHTDEPGPVGELSRRRFLALAGGVGATAGVGALLGPSLLEAVLGAVPAGAATAPGRSSSRTLVIVALYGGNDGLNTVVPYQDPAYAAPRGILAIDPSTVLPLGDGFGLHPSLGQTQKLWQSGQLAIVHGVGFADPNYSHFESMDIWQAGSTDASKTSGWIGRWLDATHASPLQAVGIGPTLAPALAGHMVQGAAIPPGPMILPGNGGEQRAYQGMAATSRAEAPLAQEAARSGTDLLTVDRVLGPVLRQTAASNPLRLPSAAPTGLAGGHESALAIANGGGGPSSQNVLATQLSIVANLILADAPGDASSSAGPTPTPPSSRPSRPC